MASKKKAASALNGSHQPKKKKAKVAQYALKQLPIKRHVSPEMVGVFANNVVVRGDGSNFHLYFFDAQPPVGLEIEAGVKSPDELEVVDAHCVARVVIPPHIMPGLIQALSANAERQTAVADALASATKK